MQNAKMAEKTEAISGFNGGINRQIVMYMVRFDDNSILL